ncbi:MAG: ADP-ribosylglycohydrolase family protein [Coriobacteriaceae bacterium]|nr:ADP-ribosylglycohydrolase family protein [Coriobacteriaceae bacterium]
MALRDAIYGLAVGDALGVPYEFLDRGSFRCEGMAAYGSHQQPKGTWSDDSSLTLATCASIKEKGCVDIDDIRRRFVLWYQSGAYAIDRFVFDVGGTTARAILSGVCEAGEFSNGNGSLMRIAPLAYIDADDDEIRAVSAITHGHAISTEACVTFVHLLRRLRRDPQAVIAELRETETAPSDEIRSGGYVLDTYRAALWCLATTDNYRDCVLRAVNLGSDTDTTAAVAGALAGELYGYAAIPAEWLAVLRGVDIIEDCLF